MWAGYIIGSFGEAPPILTLPRLPLPQIHGVIFSAFIYTDEVRFARRNGFLLWDESYYCFQAVRFAAAFRGVHWTVCVVVWLSG